jgi:hypothetical protein
MHNPDDSALFGTIEFFIERNRAGVAAIVRRRLGKHYDRRIHATTEALRDWVLNDFELYAWAIREGVKEE